MTDTKILPVLLAGGSGTRLWPLSREHYPKQFLALVDERSLLQNTVLRAAALKGVLPPAVITGEAHRFIVAEQLREAAIQGAHIVLEPEGRNSAPAAAVAAHLALRQHGPETQVLLMAADHVIGNWPAFAAAVGKASALAAAGHIVTFGIVPDRPETGFGYIKSGTELAGGGHAVERFVEKPDAATAAAFLASGGYSWNSGMFMFRARDFLAELERYEPDMARLSGEALQQARTDFDFIRLAKEPFCACRNDSIDYAVMEKTACAAVVPMAAEWDDVGSWTYLSRLPASDARGNRTRGDVILEDSDNNLVLADSRLVAAVGVRDHIIVETRDAILVTTQAAAQNVKKVVQKLKELGRYEAQHHPRVYRPWGWYETISLGERFQVKRILVNPKQKLSLQMHHHRAEHWVVVRGTAQVTCGEKVFLLAEDQSTYIPLGNQHRLENPGSIPLELIEVQSGPYLGEDDIVRFEDVYGR